jgi:hypothetical protein
MKKINHGQIMNRTSAAVSPFRFALLVLGIVLTALLSACGGGGGQVGLPTGTALFTNAPASVTLAAGAAASYTVGGGNPTYTVSSSDKDVATASISGTTFTITGVGAGTVSITVTDAVGAKLAVPVTINAPITPPVIPPGSLFTTAAGSVTLLVGANATYGIGGGRPGYAVSSSDAAVATATVSGSNFTIAGVAAGAATIVVTDAAGTALSLSVTVGQGGAVTALYTTAPSAVVIAVGSVAGYVVGGGKPAYAVSSSNAAVARVAVSGTSFTITGLAPGSAEVVVADADGDKLAIAVTIGSSSSATALFTTAPDDVKIAVGATGSYTAGGGKPAYAVSTSNAAIAKVAINGNDFIITGIASGSAQVVLSDTAGDTVTMTVQIGAGTPATALFTTATGALTLGVGVTESYAAGGGKPAYAISSSNSAVARVAIIGSDFSITGVAAGSAQVRLVDADGTSLTIAVTVGSAGNPTALFTTAPGAVTVAVGATAAYAAGGGKPAYTANTSNAAVAKVTIGGSDFVITGIGPGTANVVVGDADGASVTIGVTVGAGGATAPLYTTAPSAVSIAVGTTGTYTVGGGSGGYSATSSDNSAATVTLSGTTLTVTAVAGGLAKVTVFDSSASSVQIDVTAVAPSVISVLPGSATGNVGDSLQFLVSGGTPGYTITINNTSIATVSPASVGASGGTFNISLVNVGSTSATIVDANGQSATIPVTVSQISTVLRMSPSSLLLGENSTEVIDLNIFGGTGPYRAYTSDQTLSSVSAAGSTLTLALGSKGNRCINPITEDGVYIPNGTFDVIVTAVDSLGASASTTLTIKDNGFGLNAGCP